MKFSEISKLYIREKKLCGVKTSTLSNYIYTIESLFTPILSTEISENNLYSLIEALSLKLAKKTIADKIILLNDILKFAFKKRFIEHEIVLPLPKPSKKKIEIFTETEQRILQEYLLNNLNYFNFGILLTLFSGLRIGELAALQKKNISGQLIGVNYTLQRVKNLTSDTTKKTVLILDKPKTENSIREIPITIEIDKLFRGIYWTLSDNTYILSGNEKYIEPRTIERKYRTLLNHLNIDYKVFHTLRHTFATNSIKSGMDTKTLSELLGHSNVKITLERYVHSNIEMKRKAIQKLYTLKLP